MKAIDHLTKNDVGTSVIDYVQTPAPSNETPELTREDFFSQPISLDDTAKDISTLLKHAQLGDLPKKAVGGVFCVNQFFPRSLEDTDAGVLMWYCYNPTATGGLPKFFMSLEQMHSTGVSVNLAPLRGLQFPSRQYLYTGADKEEATVKEFLQEEFGKPDCADGGALPASAHTAYITSFRSFLIYNPNPDTGLAYNQMDWAYFQNNPDTDGRGVLSKLVNQPDVKYVRYYFGYDEGKTGKNAIRIILFAVNSQGKNLTDYIVQKSIPPAVTAVSK